MEMVIPTLTDHTSASTNNNIGRNLIVEVFFYSDFRGCEGCGGGWREGEEEVREQQHRLHAVAQETTLSGEFNIK